MDEETKVTSFRFPIPLLERFKRAAKADRRSMTQALAIAVEVYCNRIETDLGNAKAA